MRSLDRCAMITARLAANSHGRDFVVGDLHGCRKEFFDLLEQADFDKTRDRMFSVGDLVDRGPDSLGCLELLCEPWFHAVMGNHERMMLDALRGDADGELWMMNGGEWAAGLSIDEHQLLRDILDLVENLPIAIVVGEG